jgi:hypothetical protein
MAVKASLPGFSEFARVRPRKVAIWSAARIAALVFFCLRFLACGSAWLSTTRGNSAIGARAIAWV